MVLAVGDDHNDAALFALCAEALDAQANGISDGRSLHGDGPGVNTIQEHLGAHVVGGDGQLHEGRTGKDDKADAVFLQALGQARDGKLGTLQAVGGVVLRQHGVGNVQGHDNLGPLGISLGQLGAGAGPGQADGEKRKGQGKEHGFHPALGPGAGGHEGLYQRRVSEGLHATGAHISHDAVSHEENGHQNEQIQILVIGKHQHTGILLRIKAMSTSSIRHTSAARAYPPNRSLYTGKESTLVRVFSIWPISA